MQPRLLLRMSKRACERRFGQARAREGREGGEGGGAGARYAMLGDGLISERSHTLGPKMNLLLLGWLRLVRA